MNWAGVGGCIGALPCPLIQSAPPKHCHPPVSAISQSVMEQGYTYSHRPDPFYIRTQLGCVFVLFFGFLVQLRPKHMGISCQPCAQPGGFVRQCKQLCKVGRLLGITLSLYMGMIQLSHSIQPILCFCHNLCRSTRYLNALYWAAVTVSNHKALLFSYTIGCALVLHSHSHSYI